MREEGIAGRGVFATGPIARNQWLCEYKGIVYPPSDMKKYIDEYNENNEGSYIITSSHPVGGDRKLCWDATRHYHQLGRYLNHARNANAVLTLPLYVRGKWRIGFLAKTDIRTGDEVVWDYGIQGEDWLRCTLVDGVVVRVGSQTEV